VFSSLEGKLDFTAGFNPERRFTAGGSINGDNLIALLPKLFGQPVNKQIGEKHSFTATGGEEFQNVDYGVSLLRKLWGGEITPSFTMDWSRDRNQRLGPAFKPELQEVVRGLRPGVIWSRKTGDELAAQPLGRWFTSISLDCEIRFECKPAR
jgi:hypothetical protein